MIKGMLNGLLALGLVFLTLSSCTGSSKNSTKSNLTGNIIIDGSSTVYPMTEIIAEEFNFEHPDVKISIAESGTGGGIRKFINGEIDIVNASRKIKESELEKAKKNGMDVMELVVANDGISLVVSPENKFVKNLTKDEVSHIFRNENPAKYWDDVNNEFPHEIIKVYTPGAASGTFEFFTEVINNEIKSQREDAILSEDDNILVRGISNDKYSIGYFGHSYYETNSTKVNLVSIDNLNPDNENYLLSRPLYIYFDRNSLNKLEINKFINFYLMNAYDLAPEVQFMPLDKEKYEMQLSNLF